jgi:hypothetical protein
MRQTQCSLDVCGLRGFILTRQQNHQLTFLARELHPVPRSVVDPQLRHTLSDGLHVTGVST